MINAHFLSSSQFPVLTSQSFTFAQEAQAVVKSGSGKLWIAGSSADVVNGYIAKKEVNESSFTSIVTLTGTPGSAIEGFIKSFKTSSGRLLFGNANNKIYYTDNEVNLSFYAHFNATSQIRDFFQLASGKILLAVSYDTGVVDDGRIYSSTNDCASVSLVASSLDTYTVNCFYQLSNGDVLAGTGDTLNIFKSDSNATSFTQQYNGSSGRITQFCELENGDVLASYSHSSGDNGILKRLNGQTTWSVLHNSGATWVVGIIRTTAGLFATFRTSSSNTLRYSSDNGASWIIVATLPNVIRNNLDLIDNKIAICHTGGVTLFTVN